jgi:hypothetical protein
MVKGMKRLQPSKAGLAAGAGAGPGALRAGVARRDLMRRAKGALIKDPLCAKALVLDDGSTRLAIVAVDTVDFAGVDGDIGSDFVPKLRARIQKELKIPGCHVLVNASHVHTPRGILCSPAEQVDRTFETVKRAVSNMTAARVGAGAGRERRIAMNRTLRLKSGKHWTIRHANPCPPDEAVAGVGPMDPEIGLIRIDRMDGRPLAVVYNFACHPLFGDARRGAVSANFPSVASSVIEEALGQEAMAIFLQGAGGDAIDVLFKDFNRPRDIEPLGTMLGLTALKALRRIRTRNVKLNIISGTIRLPRRRDIPERIGELRREQAELLESLRSTSLNFKSFLPRYLEHLLDPAHPSHYSYRYLQEDKIGSDQLAAMDSHNKACIEKYLNNIYAMEKLARIQERIANYKLCQAENDVADEPTVEAEVQGIKIGDCIVITSPAEMVAEVGLKLKKASPYKHTFIAACSNGYIYYAPAASDYGKGGYEATTCLLAPEWQKIYEDKANEIIRRL